MSVHHRLQRAGYDGRPMPRQWPATSARTTPGSSLRPAWTSFPCSRTSTTAVYRLCRTRLPRLAAGRQKVTVSLSGDGGDEALRRLSPLLLGLTVGQVSRIPQVTRPASAALRAVPVGTWNAPLSPRRRYPRFFAAKRRRNIYKLARAMTSRNPDWLYHEIVRNGLTSSRHAPARSASPPGAWPRIDDYTSG